MEKIKGNIKDRMTVFKDYDYYFRKALIKFLIKNEQ